MSIGATEAGIGRPILIDPCADPLLRRAGGVPRRRARRARGSSHPAWVANRRRPALGTMTWAMSLKLANLTACRRDGPLRRPERHDGLRPSSTPAAWGPVFGDRTGPSSARFSASDSCPVRQQQPATPGFFRTSRRPSPCRFAPGRPEGPSAATFSASSMPIEDAEQLTVPHVCQPEDVDRPPAKIPSRCGRPVTRSREGPPNRSVGVFQAQLSARLERETRPERRPRNRPVSPRIFERYSAPARYAPR